MTDHERENSPADISEEDIALGIIAKVFRDGEVDVISENPDGTITEKVVDLKEFIVDEK